MKKTIQYLGLTRRDVAILANFPGETDIEYAYADQRDAHNTAARMQLKNRIVDQVTNAIEHFCDRPGETFPTHIGAVY